MNLILIAATYRRHEVFSRRRMRQMSLSPNSGNTNDLQTTLGEGQPCGYRGHLVCTGNSTLPAADPAVMETGTVAPLHKLPKKKKSSLTSGHLSKDLVALFTKRRLAEVPVISRRCCCHLANKHRCIPPTSSCFMAAV